MGRQLWNLGGFHQFELASTLDLIGTPGQFGAASCHGRMVRNDAGARAEQAAFPSPFPIDLKRLREEQSDRVARMPVDLVELASNGDWPQVHATLLGESHSVKVLSLALTRAVGYEHLEMTQLLIEAGADPNFCFDDQIPALFVAVQTHTLSIVELLLTHGADINLRMRDGITALILAVDAIADYSYQSGGPLSLDLVRFLLAQGADSTLQDDQGETAADVARSYGWAEAVQVLEAAQSQPSSLP